MTAVRSLEPDDWPAVEALYREGIASGHATFEATPPLWDEFWLELRPSETTPHGTFHPVLSPVAQGYRRRAHTT